MLFVDTGKRTTHARTSATCTRSSRRPVRGRSTRLRLVHSMTSTRLRLPRPGIPDRSGWARPSRRLRPPPRPSSPKPTPRSANRSAALAWDGPAEELDRTENAQPALLATSIAYPRGAPRALGRAPASPRPRPRSRRPLDGPVLARSSRPASSRSSDGIRLVRERGRLMQASGRARRRDGRAHRARRRRLPELVVAASAPRHLRRREPQLPRARSSCRASAPAVEAGAEIAKDARRQARDRAAGLRRGPLPAHGEAAAACARVSRTSRSTTRPAAARQRGRAAR